MLISQPENPWPGFLSKKKNSCGHMRMYVYIFNFHDYSTFSLIKHYHIQYIFQKYLRFFMNFF